ncbi:MAG: phage major tail protein, TP901-1 family [Ahrensia sp.]|nr:phage major tail protein, TP901-1 family [Ahrensia sp.]
MTAQRGKDLLLKLINGGTPTTVAGMRSRRIAFNTDTVDVTDFESAGRWRQLLAGAGVQRASISGSGIFKDSASDEMVRGLFFNGTIESWQIVIPDFGTVEGEFQITALEYSGEHTGEVTFDLALESAGPLSFTAS